MECQMQRSHVFAMFTGQTGRAATIHATSRTSLAGKAFGAGQMRCRDIRPSERGQFDM